MSFVCAILGHKFRLSEPEAGSGACVIKCRRCGKIDDQDWGWHVYVSKPESLDKAEEVRFLKGA